MAKQDGIRTRPRWRVALLVVSSACLSGIALVLWNRSALERIRATGPADSKKAAKTETEFV